ncbi:hypothetical protein BC941DRAFT_431258 [Chlamydoabsidia padenii]|nr:hypothetical protein BC941DRAFT_431258 [Chlamydoabsidia padenii]
MTIMKPLWLAFTSLLCIILVSAHEPTSFIRLDPTYQSSKHIAFACYVPGSSHITWVLRFLDELVSRGHNVTFLTVESNLKYGADYPRINTVNITIPNTLDPKFITEFGSHPDFMAMLPIRLQMMTSIWTPEYENTIKFIEDKKVDAFICDHRSGACIDAVHTKKVPMIVTATIAVFQDAGTSYINNNLFTLDDYTTRDQTIYRRFYNKFIIPFYILYRAGPALKNLAFTKAQAGLPDSHLETTKHRTTHALKLINSLFGIEVARPIGPLIELVGPLLSPHYPSLDKPFESFLANHHHVVYVAFGQHAAPDAFDVKQVLTPLVQQYEQGHIDGIIWSSKNAQPDHFPTLLTTRQHDYNLTSCFDDNDAVKEGLMKDLLVTRWSPQMAVLMHPSVSVFVSHGGANSLFESLYAGKRMIFYPFFGDQPGTAKLLSRDGLSEYFDHKTDRAVINERVEKVILDKEGTYQHHIRRYQALIQIHSKTAPIRAADLVEEVAFANHGGDDAHLLSHREDVGHDIPWIKRNNLDLYAIVLLMVGSTLTVFGLGVYKLAVGIYHSYCVTRKTKIL